MMWEESNLTNVHQQAHLKSDVDSSVRAQHHTLGEGPLQAASGYELAKLRKEIFLLSHPVGAVYITEVSTNPGTLYGGTWIAYGAGRVIVGLDAGQTEFDTVAETGGAKTHTLTIAEMPDHDHGQNGHVHAILRSSVVGGNAATVARGGSNDAGDANTAAASPALTGSRGGGGAHNNLQPYIVAYMWKRTA